MFFFSKYFDKIKNHLFLENFYKDFSNFSKTTRYFFLIVFGPLRRVHKISFRIFRKRNWKFFLFQNISQLFFFFWEKKGCVEWVIWYFSILIWAAKRGGRSFFTRRELFLKVFLRYLPQPEEITHKIHFCLSAITGCRGDFRALGPYEIEGMDGMGRTGRSFWSRKKQPFRNFMETYFIFFPACFWSPQKYFEDILLNIPNWKNLIFFSPKKYLHFFLTKKSGCVKLVVWSIFQYWFTLRWAKVNIFVKNSWFFYDIKKLFQQ